MAKMNKILEVIAYDFFYKNKAIVFVEKNNRIEKHAYEVDSKDKLLVYAENSEDHEKNPTIKGTTISLDSDSKNIMLYWKEDSKYALPLGENVELTGDLLSSNELFRLVTLGRTLERSNNPIIKQNNDTNDIKKMAYIMLGIMVLNFFLLYMVSQKVGVSLFGGGG